MPLPLNIFSSTVGNEEPMQLDMHPEDENGQEIVERNGNPADNNMGNYLVENATIDLEAYANSYQGLARITRLMFIAEHSTSLRIEALKMCLSYIKEKTHNVNMYQQVYKKLSEAISAAGGSVDAIIGPMDTQWIETRSKKAAMKLEKLDTDLKSYKSNSIKESIRRGHDDLGDHYLDCGDLSNALKCYSRSRDYCTSGKHVLNMCLNVLKVSVYLQNWSHVITYVSKAEGTPEYQPGSNIATKLHCAAGLADLAAKKYKNAAKHFLNVNFDHFGQGGANEVSGDIISPNNVAVYGGLCAVATYDRHELHKNVMSSSSFKLFLELEPQTREAITKFYESKYAQCLSLLDEIKDNLLLDLYLAPHVNTLYGLIRNRALIQYFSPYLSADMNKMAQAFNTSVGELEDELMQLILEGQIQARIDSHNKILYAKDVDQRSVTFERAIEMGKEWQRRTRALILRSAMHKNGQIQVKCPQQGTRQASDDAVASGSGPSGSENTPSLNQRAGASKGNI